MALEKSPKSLSTTCVDGCVNVEDRDVCCCAVVLLLLLLLLLNIMEDIPPIPEDICDCCCMPYIGCIGCCGGMVPAANISPKACCCCCCIGGAGAIANGSKATDVGAVGCPATETPNGSKPNPALLLVVVFWAVTLDEANVQHLQTSAGRAGSR